MPRGLTPLSWLRRQSAQRRLQAGFGLLIALLLAVAGLAALRFNEYRSTVDAYADGSMQRIRLAAELSADTGVVSRMLISLITGDRDVRLAAYDAIESAHRRINGNVAALQELQELARRRAMPMAAALRDYLVAYQRTVELVEAGDAEQLREYMATQTEGALGQLALLSNRLLRDEQARALTLAMAQQTQLRLDLWVLAGACLVAVLAGSALIFAIRRSITQPLQRTEDAARRMATGDYTARAQVRGHDEVAGVAAALNGLAEAVSLREAEIRRMAQTDAMTG
ncbi:MAG: HAMP domain-containing protein, partial [Inhella sp.]|nr:HAMP domain-containing protein [Inhella sp.]